MKLTVLCTTYDDKSTRKKPNNPASLVCQENGQERVDCHVTQQEGTQQQVSILAQWVNLSRVLGIDGVVAFHDNFQARLVEAHESQGESTKECTKQNEADNHNDLNRQGDATERIARFAYYLKLFAANCVAYVVLQESI